MSFREDFLKKISGFSYERLRTEQRLLEQERESSEERKNLLTEKKENLENQAQERFRSRSKPLREEIEVLKGKIGRRNTDIESKFFSNEQNKRKEVQEVGSFDDALSAFWGTLFFAFLSSVYISLPIFFFVPEDLYLLAYGCIAAFWVLFFLFFWPGVAFGKVLNEKKAAHNAVIDKKLEHLITSDKKLLDLKSLLNPLEVEMNEVHKNSEEFRTDNIEPINEEISALEKRISEISILLKDVLPDLLKTTRKKERNAKYKAVLGEARDQSQSIKNFLLSETDENWTCPYCNEKKDKETAEADHIHPVSKGGQSTLQNMVLICYDCNRGKGDSTLRNFCKVKGFSFDEVCERLESDGKEI